MLALISEAAAAERVARLPCPSPGNLVEASRSAVISYSKARSREEGYYACFRGHRARFLGPSGENVDGGVRRPVLGGRFVAFTASLCTRDPSYSCAVFVERRDLVTNRPRRFIVQKSEQYRDQPPRAVFRALTLSTTGEMAWGVQTQAGGVIQAFASKSSAAVTLDTGPSVDPSTVAVGGGAVFWTNAGQPRMALLRTVG